MTKLYDLKAEMVELQEEMQWAETDEEREEILERLQHLQMDAEGALVFVANILAEQIGQTRVAEAAFNEAKTRLEKKVKQCKAAEEKWRGVLLRNMVLLDIKKVKGDILNVSHRFGPPSLIINSDMDIDAIPGQFVTIVPETKEINKEELKEFLKNNIEKSATSDINPMENILNGEDIGIPGVALVRKEALYVR